MNHILAKLQAHMNLPETPDKKSPEKLHEPFLLPIEYLDASHKHPLSAIVSTDLELMTSQSEAQSTYDTLFKPSHQFAKNMIPEWNHTFTSHIPYLEDTQQVLTDMATYHSRITTQKGCTMDTEHCERVMNVWDAAKNDDSFMERYSYIDWQILEYLNHSSGFLQGLSMIHILSPLFSLFLPFLFLLIPFLLLKFNKAPITFGSYVEMLKMIARNHFIGKALMSVQGGMSIDKIAYLLMIVAFYGLQMYQNVNACARFYRNVKRVNTYLYDLRNYIDASIHKMETFATMHHGKPTYEKFCKTTTSHVNVLITFAEELATIQPFGNHLGKITEIGYIMKCFYRLHQNQHYDTSLRYSFGFEGYIDNLRGVHENVCEGVVNYAGFSTTKKTKLVEQYYPALAHESSIVKNTCKFDKNMIVSAPNAAGKTTLLKTTTINIIVSQQVGCGFYASSVIQPYTHVHSYLNIPDTSGRDSLFQAESRRCKEIITLVQENTVDTSRHFCIFDELYSGTNPTEAGKSAYAFLKYLSKHSHVDFMLTTHYVYVCKKFRKSAKIANYKMGVEDLADGGFKFTYLLEPGISEIQGAIKILKEMDYPEEMIQHIEGCK
jgi:hypothetical protein